jgi:regulatory protein
VRVEELRKITDRKYRVLLEDGSSFVLYAGELRRFHIEEGGLIAEEALKEIMDGILLKRAQLRCMNLLKSMDRTVSQLTAVLKRDGYPDRIIQGALEYMAACHYTDDRRYAENYIRLRAGKRSLKQIRYDLLGKGIEAGLASELLEQLPSSAGDDPLLSQELYGEQGRDPAEESPDISAIRLLMRKRHFDPGEADFDQSRRFIQYLMRKGFSLTDIRKALGRDNIE